MGELAFVIQAKDAEEFGRVILTKDELRGFLRVHNGTHISMSLE